MAFGKERRLIEDGGIAPPLATKTSERSETSVSNSDVPNSDVSDVSEVTDVLRTPF
jgi:hypothetical protein